MINQIGTIGLIKASSVRSPNCRHLFEGVEPGHYFHLLRGFASSLGHRAEDELGVLLKRDAPALLQPGFEFIFLSVWRIVSCEMVFTILCSMSASFKRCKPQRLWPLTWHRTL